MLRFALRRNSASTGRTLILNQKLGMFRRSPLLSIGAFVLLSAAIVGFGWSVSASGPNGPNGRNVAKLNPNLSAALPPVLLTITVTTGDDSGAGSLRDAIANASPGDTINFDPGVSTINLTTSGISIDKNLTITGPGAGLLTVQRSTAGGTPQFRIFNITNGTTVTISGLTVSNGNSVGGLGGAIHNDRGTLTITGCTFTQNVADVGGAIFNLGQSGTANLTINNSTFSQNAATTGSFGQGGAIYNVGATGTANLTVTNSTFTQNTSKEGGGIFSVGLNNNGIANLTVLNSSFSQNNGSSDGGALVSAGDDGGVATTKITNATFNGNTAGEGGAILNVAPDGTANLGVVNSTFSQNSASSDSGAIFNDAFEDGTATLSVTNSTFSGNSAPANGGGGIFNYTLSTTELNAPPGNAILQIGNTIFKRGASGANILSAPDGIVTSLGHNLSDDSAGASGGTGPDGYLNQTGDIRNTDPLLGALAGNGGPTQTHLPLAGSPAIDAGSNALAVDQDSNPLTTDQRGTGFPRIVNVTVDIGAVEVSSGPSPSLSIVQQPTNTIAGQAISPAVTVAILDELGQPTTSTANVSVSIGTNPSAGTLSGTTTVAAVNGTATFNNLSINKAGTGYTLNATSGGATSAASNPFNITAAAANKLAFGQQPTSSILGNVISPPVTVQILDSFNNLTTSTANVSISIGTIPGGGTLSGTTPVAAVNGTATFNNLSINLGGSGYTLSAASSGLTGTTSNSFNVTGTPTHIDASAGSGQSATVGTSFGTALKATVTDDFTGLSGVNVTFTAPSTGASGTFAGGGTTATAITDSNGVATAPLFTANATIGPYNVTANVTPGLPTPATFSLTNVACGGGALVTNNNDSGSGSLRNVIANACVGSTITFGPGVVSPITLTSGELLIDKSLTITGPGANLLTVQRSTAGGTPQFRIFSITHTTTLNLSGLTISNGNSGGGTGGAVFIERGTLTARNCTFTQNSADVGGAIASLGDFGSTNVTIINSTFSQNSATTGLGQGAAIYSVGADANGVANVTIQNSTFNQNSAKEGGAIFSVGLRAGGTATVSLVNSTLSQNSGSIDSGGIINDALQGGAATFNITNSTFSENSALPGQGAAIFNFASGAQSSAVLNIGNTILKKGAASGANIVNSGTVISLGHNMSDDSAGAGSGTDPAGYLNQTGDIRNTDPLLGALANNGGPTQTHLLLAGSPAIEAGSDALLPADTFDLDGDGNTAETLPVDQRGVGFARVSGTVDIGAVEFGKANQTITVNTHAPSNAVFNTGFTVAATSSSGLAVSFSSSGACTNVGANFTMTSGTGTCTVKYDQAGDPNFNAAPQVTESVTAQKANQTITVNTHAPASAVHNTGFTVAATSSSSLAVSFSSSGVCTNVGANFTMTSGTGTCTVKYDQAGNSDFNAAPQVTESVTAQQANQTITFGALSNKTFGDPDFTVSATASSGLSVSFGATGNCTVTGTTVHITGAGSCTITASQAGNGDYNAATNVPQSFNIAKAATATAVSSSNNPSALSQSVTFTATVTSGAGTPTGTVQFKDNGTNLGAAQALNGSGVATLATSALTAGTHTITADYSGDVNFAVSTGTLSGGQVVTNQALISFSQAAYSVGEGDGFRTITVNRSGITSSAVSVDYTTSDGAASLLPCSTANGLASSRCDFTTALGTLSFAAGETSKTFVVLISQDSYVEGPETLALTLSNPTGGAALIAPSTATITINDDVSEPATNPNDVPSDFVRQHYNDFLNRDADAPGLAFWTNQINACGANAQCIEVARINVSAAFYLSIEFQGTGYLVERLYKTSYGDATGTSTVGGAHQLPVPIVRLNEFLHDSQEIGLGIIVGAPGWEQALENNKQAFAAEFVQRSRFTTAYPLTLTPAQFVDTLNANAGNPLSVAERNQLVNDLTSATKTRAQVLRAVAEDPDLVSAEFNRAFVLMQFLGYLRRNPNDTPDVDYSGYDFWLTKLNQFNGNFQNAEMVKGFITSLEYRKRFGQ